MSATMRHGLITSIFLGFSVLVGCGSAGEDVPTAPEDWVGTGDGQELTSRTVSVPAGGSASISLRSQGSPMNVAVDCGVPSNPDDTGPLFEVSSAVAGLGGASDIVAGYWERATALASGTHAMKIVSHGGALRCVVRADVVRGTCDAWSVRRSPVADHNHVEVGSTNVTWEPFPASGNHWGAWAKWNQVYDKPVKTGFVLHNLEHGGAVLSYKCPSAAGASCAAARDALVAWAERAGVSRIIITPDPNQPTLFAIRTWRTAYTSECLNEASATAFLRKNIRRGREDTDADPPLPYDPTTLSVPCRNLMAAPDSCPN